MTTAATTAKYEVTWDLDSLLPHPETTEFQSAFEKFRTNLEQLAERSDELPGVSGVKSAVSIWVEFLKDYEQMSAQAVDLNAFVGCHAAAAAENKLFQQLEGKLSALDPLRERMATNIEFSFKNASDEGFSAFIAADDWLETISFYLTEARRNSEMRLPRAQELLVADLSVDGIHAWGRLYDRLSGALRVQVMERGEIVEKSPGQVQFDSPQRSVRENNFFAADKAWSRIADTCADTLNHISGTRLTLYRHLELSDHLEAPLRHNRMRRKTLDAMWSAVSDRKGCLLKYLEKKAELLGLDKLTWYDAHAPLPQVEEAGTSAELSYDDACDLVIKTFSEFSDDFGEFGRKAIENRWIEVENRSGKRQGGFCTGFPTKQESRIFMTFTNSPDSMSTLAHELGHAYHSHVLRDQPLFLQDYPMNLAETASTFAEAVLGERRLSDSRSKSESLSILDNMLGDSVSFLMNIHARFIFEDNFHQERIDGELTTDRLCELMLFAQKEAYLDSLDSDGWNPNFWVSKLHFYISGLPFYNFPYTFGYLLSLGVYATSATAGAEFAEQYRRLLIATGCQQTEDAVASTLGHDLGDSAFWNKSLDVVEKRVEKFLELADS